MSQSASLSDLAAVLDEIEASVPPSSHTGGGGGTSPSSSEESFAHVETPARARFHSPSLEGESTEMSSSTLPAAVLAVSHSEKRYCLWQAPDTFENSCFRLIGQGSAFCIISDCSVAHKSTKHFHPLPGEIYVKKHNTQAFIAPSISSSILTKDLLEAWFATSCTIVEWNERFALAKHEEKYPILRKTDEKISQVDLEAKEVLMVSTLAFKTPAKKRRVSPFQLQIDLPEVESLSDPIPGSENHLYLLNQKLVVIAKALETIYVSQQKEASMAVESFQHTDARITMVEQAFGTPPQNLDEVFQAPNLWLTLGSVADLVKGLQLEVSKLKSSNVSTTIQANVNVMNKQIHELNMFAVDAIRKLNKRINLTPSVSSDNLKSFFIDEINQRESILTSRMNEMEKELAALRSSKDSTVIKFGQLGFRSQQDCTAWLQLHHPGNEFGLLVDFHLVMEHVFVQINGQKLLANLEKIYKMDLRSNNQALAISSFEGRLPRFFSQDSKVHVKKDESYFHGIKSWDEWDLPNDGFRDRLNVELHLFKNGHLETLDNELTHLSPFHNLCVLALTESVAWVDSLIKFVDDTYNEYSRSRYGHRKAWHITTRLAKSLIEKVATPRNSIHNSFTINKPSQVSKSITYASLRSLDLMMDIIRVNFKNSPIITAELSKFLALNTNYEALEQVQKKISTIETDHASMKKEVKSAVSAANTAGNKWDSTLKPQFEDFKKRIRSLESRN